MSIDKKQLLVLTGAGISAESGLSTFRDTGGTWDNYPVEEVATPEAWHKNPQKVLDFYNARRQAVRNAKPNPAHIALVELARYYPVKIITQNVDDLHERAGSKNVLHIHGEIMKARSTVDSSLVYELGEKDIAVGDLCAKGSQLRPHIVWFNEEVCEFETAAKLVKKADVLVIIGTSLTVYPVASLTKYYHGDSPIYVIAPELSKIPDKIIWYQEKAAQFLPKLVKHWLINGIVPLT